MSIYVKSNEEQEAEYEYDYMKDRYPILLQALKNIVQHKPERSFADFEIEYQRLKNITKEALKKIE